jgi:hypothetical protein
MLRGFSHHMEKSKLHKHNLDRWRKYNIQFAILLEMIKPQTITSHFCILLEMMQSDKSQNLNKSLYSKI